MKDKFQNFLEAEPPYKKIRINSRQLEELSTIEHFSIEHYCSVCGKIRTFKSNGNPLKIIKNDYGMVCISHGGQYSYEKFSSEYSNCFLLDFHCQHDCSEYHYFPIRISGLEIAKIGQYPSYAKEEVSGKIRQYKNIISDYYPELTRALSAYSQNMGVASFVYLRRILEHLINKKYCSYGYSKQIKFVDKLHKVEKKEKIFPDEIKEVKEQIYAVLSKGVHEYDEENCLAMFPSVLFVIERILDEELYVIERKRKAQEAKDAIQNQLKKDNNNG